MKFAMVQQLDALVPALQRDDELVILQGLAPDLVTLIEGGADAIGAVKAVADRRDTPRLRLERCRLASPLTRFRRDILCTGWNYYEHFKEGEALRGNVERPSAPTFFTKGPDTVVGPTDPIRIDSGMGTAWDYEAEIAFVIGRSGRSISRQNAADHIFGYMLANDVSQRELQRRHGQWFKGKSIDDTMPLGPFLVTADEFDPKSAAFELFLNGDLMQQGFGQDMAFAVDELVAELSWGMKLGAGDVVLTGTPAGVGQSRKPPVFLADGDVVEITCAQLGHQRNKVVDIAAGVPMRTVSTS